MNAVLVNKENRILHVVGNNFVRLEAFLEGYDPQPRRVAGV